MKVYDFPDRGWRIHIPDPTPSPYAQMVRATAISEARRCYRRGFLTGVVAALAAAFALWRCSR